MLYICGVGVLHNDYVEMEMELYVVGRHITPASPGLKVLDNVLAGRLARRHKLWITIYMTPVANCVSVFPGYGETRAFVHYSHDTAGNRVLLPIYSV